MNRQPFEQYFTSIKFEKLSPEEIIKRSAEHFNIDADMLSKPDRYHKYHYPRWHIYLMLSIDQYLMLNHGDIAKYFKRDRTTILHGIQQLKQQMQIYPETMEKIREHHKAVYGHDCYLEFMLIKMLFASEINK